MTQKMTNPYDGNDLVSPELAERLAKLGVVGGLVLYKSHHQAYGKSGLIVEVGASPLGEATYRLSCGGWYLAKEMTWLPRRIDLEAELVKRGHSLLATQKYGVCLFECQKGDSRATYQAWSATAETPAEAIGLALEQAMKGER